MHRAPHALRALQISINRMYVLEKDLVPKLPEPGEELQQEAAAGEEGAEEGDRSEELVNEPEPVPDDEKTKAFRCGWGGWVWEASLAAA